MSGIGHVDPFVLPSVEIGVCSETNMEDASPLLLPEWIFHTTCEAITPSTPLS